MWIQKGKKKDKNKQTNKQTRKHSKGDSVLVALHMEGQVVGPWEAATARYALEWLGSRVLAVVPRQLVRTGELPVTALPAASIRLLSCSRQTRKTKQKQNHEKWDRI